MEPLGGEERAPGLDRAELLASCAKLISNPVVRYTDPTSAVGDVVVVEIGSAERASTAQSDCRFGESYVPACSIARC